jgi:hypothetical protein
MRFMDSVFISSIQRDYGDVRQAARRTVESLGMRPVMAETAGARDASPQRALLDLVAHADVFLLILGPRYSKPTEDEFDEGRRRAKPILVLRQVGEAEPEQNAFADRVAGGWTGGKLWGSFNDASDVGFAVVQALTNLRQQTGGADRGPEAQARARELAVGRRQGGSGYGSSIARVAFVPVAGEPLLDALALDRRDLGDDVAALVRQHRLVAQSVGIESRVTAAGVGIHPAGGYANADPLISVGSDGAVVAAFDVGGTDQFGGMRVDPQRLAHGIAAAGSFARAAWDMLDEREIVQQVAISLAIPEAQHKVFGASTGGNSIQMGGAFGSRLEVVVPDPPRIIRRAEVGSDESVARLLAEVRRVFADAGAVQR